MSNVEREPTATLRHAFLPVRAASKARPGSEGHSVSPSCLAHSTLVSRLARRYEEINVNLMEKPEWYLARNAPGQVPALEWIDHDSKQTRLIPESLIVVDYLESTHPEPQLAPKDPFVRAQQRVLIDRFSNVGDRRTLFLPTFARRRSPPLSTRSFEAMRNKASRAWTVVSSRTRKR